MDIKGAEPVAYKAGLAFLDESFEVKADPTTPTGDRFRVWI